MKIFVTGGAGFIGSHIVDRLVGLGHETVVLDNLSAGKTENLNPNSTFYEADLFKDNIHNLFERERPQYVLHLAAQASVGNSQLDPVTDCCSNIVGSIKLLECCRKYQVKKIIYSSSAAVYGTPLYLPVDEAHMIFPQSNYGISKYVPELYIKAYQRNYGLNYSILRYSNVYGPRQDSKAEGGVISIFLKRLLNGMNLEVFGDGNQTRDFIYVDDIVSANIAALHHGENDVFNISTNTSTSINELLGELAHITGKTTETIYSEAAPGDIYASVLNNTKARKHLNWSPRYSISEGLIKFSAALGYNR
ncbi:MAG: NAD-dependent epimerase/dehydratase family protein [Clostridia bacterium]|nr:NAD-dependent epimerase/dehydratase family protein [Clostridia bacterium]